MSFPNLLPKFTYDFTDLLFAIPPLHRDPTRITITPWASTAEPDINSLSEYVPNNQLLQHKEILICNHYDTTKVNDFYLWWDVVRDGREFTYYPDQDDLTTSYPVVNAMEDFEIKENPNGLFSFEIEFLYI